MSIDWMHMGVGGSRPKMKNKSRNEFCALEVIHSPPQMFLCSGNSAEERRDQRLILLYMISVYRIGCTWEKEVSDHPHHPSDADKHCSGLNLVHSIGSISHLPYSSADHNLMTIEQLLLYKERERHYSDSSNKLFGWPNIHGDQRRKSSLQGKATIFVSRGSVDFIFDRNIKPENIHFVGILRFAKVKLLSRLWVE